MAKVLRAADVMTKDVVTVSPDATVAEAVKLMREKKVSSLVVERRTHDDAWGIMTRKDVVSKVIEEGPPQGQGLRHNDIALVYGLPRLDPGQLRQADGHGRHPQVPRLRWEGDRGHPLQH